jgi:ABC-2 type transport system permease protein
MIFLSGATIPFEILPRPVQAAAQIFPAPQGIVLLKAAVLGSPMDGLAVPIAVLSAFAVVSYTVSIRFFKWE